MPPTANASSSCSLTKLRTDPRLLGHEASEQDLGVMKAVKEVLGANRPRLAAAKKARSA